MSDTVNRADDCQKILDNGHVIVMYRGGMGSYLAAVIDDPRKLPPTLDRLVDRLPEHCLTDDFTPSQALYRLAEKFTTGRVA